VSDLTTGDPPLAQVTRQAAGTDGSTDATPITDGVHMSPGVTNSYLVTTPDGPVVINAGSAQEAERSHLPRYRRIDPRAPVFIITTQSHRDHMGGVPVLAGPETKWIAHETSPAWRADVRMLHDTYLRRRNELWSQVLDSAVDLGNRAGPDRQADILVGDFWTFEVGGRRFELLATPGGETTDSIVVWLPDDGAVFTSNLFGPIFGGMPNLATLRGDKQRSATQLISSLERVRSLGPELLITGHGDPVRGGAQIDLALTRVRDAVQYLHDRTVEGMNAGKDLFTLMREVELPPELALPEFHGKTSWNVRSIWHEYLGWFRMDSTTELYPVPATSVAKDLVALAGAGALIRRARRHLDEGRPVESLHLSDIVLHERPSDTEGLRTRHDALVDLLEGSGGANFSEVMWLRAQIERTSRLLASAS
jgi:alkyl sulfatase BDS1-like metallo-beta-lactamase superfamily hydrolase